MKRGSLIIGVYVDGMLIMRNDNDIMIFEDELKTEFSLRSTDDISSFIG